MGGALLESPMRTAIHGKSRVSSSAISVELNCLQYLFYHDKQNLKQLSYLWRWPSGLGVGVVIIGLCKMKVRAHVGMFTISFFSNDFYFSFVLGLMDLSDAAILSSGPNSCCQQNPKCFDKPL